MKKIGLLPKLILGIIAGIADLGKQAGRTLGITALIAYCSAVAAGFVAFFIDSAILPGVITMGELSMESRLNVAPFFTIQMGQIMGVMAALGLMSSMLGFAQPQLDLMIALRFAQDSFGTATNVTGDGAIAIIVDSLFNKNFIQEAQL